ncbi:mannose-1-phosphate guanylyltransferase [Salana multivorans]
MTDAPAVPPPAGDLVAIVPAGGAGTRLWPLSRRSRPKFLLDLLGSGRTLLQATADRLLPLTGAAGLYVVTGLAHAEAVAGQLPGLPSANLLAEPSPRDSMAAIALAAAVVEHREGPRVVASFAADHVIPDGEAFRATVRTAMTAAEAGYVTTIGITATGPSTAFGYIERGEGLTEAPGAFAVARFVEKPDAETAAGYLATGRYSWNAGMFVVRTDVLLGHLDRLQPPLAAGVREIAAAWDSPDRTAVLDRVWPTLTRIAIDHAIAEPVAAEGGVAVVPGTFGWDDVGDVDALAGLLEANDDGVVVLRTVSETDDDAESPGSESPVVAVDSPGAFVVPGTGAPAVAVVGLPGVAVVRTPDALLVLSREAAQDVKTVVDRLRAAGREELL